MTGGGKRFVAADIGIESEVWSAKKGNGSASD